MDNQENQDTRTKEETFLDLPPATEDFNSYQYSAFLDSLFNLGEVPEKQRIFEVFPGFVVKLRILTPVEMVEVLKIVDTAPGDNSKKLLLKLETLSRSIEVVNGQFLRFSESMIKEWQEFRGIKTIPMEVEQQRFILKYRFKQFIIDEIFSKYEELVREQEKVLASLKKNS